MNYNILFDPNTIYDGYKVSCRHKQKKLRTLQFKENLIDNLYDIQLDLLNECYLPGDFERFKVFEPKERNIEAPAFKDKIVLHEITDNGLYHAITSSFIRNNCSNQIHKGISDAMIRVKHCLLRYYSKYHTSNGWILKCDIHHFFASIDHDIIKEKLKRICIKFHIDKRIFDLLCIYIDKTEGLPLGYQTSQLLALLMLNDLDHYITEVRGFNLYVRGMDDFIIIAHDKKELQNLLLDIKVQLDAIHLQLNDKTNIFPISNGVDFLGYHHYLTESGAVVQKLRQSSVKKVKQRIKDWRYLFENHLISSQEIKASFLAWDAFAAYGDTYELRRNLADKVEDMIHESITIHRKYNSTRLQREARRQKQERCIAENRRKKFEKDSIESGYYHPEAFESTLDESISSIPEVKEIIKDIKSKNDSRPPNSSPYISNVLIPIDDNDISNSSKTNSIMENNVIDQNTKIEKSNSKSIGNFSNSDSTLDEKKIDYDDYLNTPPWEERT